MSNPKPQIYEVQRILSRISARSLHLSLWFSNHKKKDEETFLKEATVHGGNTFPVEEYRKELPPASGGFTGQLHQTFKEDVIPILYHLFPKIEAERIFPNMFYEANSTPKSNKQIHTEKTSID